MNVDISHGRPGQPVRHASIPTDDGLAEGLARLTAAQDALASLLADLQSELNGTSALWGEGARQAYVEAQRSWEASTARQRQIVADIPAHARA